MEGFCPKCKVKSYFKEDEEGKKLVCSKCGNSYHKCFNKNCTNMISFGVYCSDCVGKGIKKVKAGALLVAGTIIVSGVKLVKKKYLKS